MTRMMARQLAIQLLFSMEINRLSPDEAAALFFSDEHYVTLKGEDAAYEEYPDEVQMAYIRSVMEAVQGHAGEIDAVIETYAREWKVQRISKMTLAILRCAIAEILYLEEVTPAVAVNEAVEQGKRYESPEAGAFINGILGSFLRERA